jgi:aconitate hydratase
MGVVPLQFLPGENAHSLGLTGEESFETLGLAQFLATPSANREIAVLATRPGGSQTRFTVRVRIDTQQEIAYYLHGGILPYVLRTLG